ARDFVRDESDFGRGEHGLCRSTSAGSCYLVEPTFLVLALTIAHGAHRRNQPDRRAWRMTSLRLAELLERASEPRRVSTAIRDRRRTDRERDEPSSSGPSRAGRRDRSARRALCLSRSASSYVDVRPDRGRSKADLSIFLLLCGRGEADDNAL